MDSKIEEIESNLSEGMGDKIDKIYESLTGATGVPGAVGLFYNIPTSGKLSDLAISVGKDLSKVTSANFIVGATRIAGSGYAGAACPSNWYDNATNVSVSYNSAATQYSVNGASLHCAGNDTHCNISMNYSLYVRFA